jgi:hypothetical protein
MESMEYIYSMWIPYVYSMWILYGIPGEGKVLQISTFIWSPFKLQLDSYVDHLDSMDSIKVWPDSSKE